SHVVRILEAATVQQHQHQQQQLQQHQQQHQQQLQLQLLARLVWRKVGASVSSLTPAELGRAVLAFNGCGLRLPLLFQQIEERALAAKEPFPVSDALTLFRGFAAAAFSCDNLLQKFEPLLQQHAQSFTRKEVQLLQQILSEAEETKFGALREALAAR
ncbi:hypothetical protein, conserved, partial [Eimeria tenella]